METEYPRASAVGPFFRYYAALLAEGLERAGRFGDALEILGPALATVTEPGVGVFVSELHRIQGVCLLRAGANKDEAMHSLRTAAEVAKQQHATVLELRATVSLARAAIALGRPAEGIDSLRTLCAELAPEFDAAELSEAREVLMASQ
jgi:predicted ATPase